MELGFGLITAQRYPGDPRTPTDLYRELLEQSQAAESVGLDSVWTSEHHFWDDDYMPSLLVTSAAIAARTERIQIGTGILLAPLYHPLRLAEDAATVDLISGGRLILGLGAGWRQEEFDRLGASMEKLGPQMAETVAILKKAWGPDVFRHDGKVRQIEATNVTPKPSREIPIWLGGFVDPAVTRAGRIADGYLGSSSRRTGDSLEEVARRVELCKEGLDKAGRDASEFTFAFHETVWVSDDPDADFPKIADNVHYTRWKYADMGPEFGRKAGPLPKAPELDENTRQAIRDSLILGTPEDVAGRFKAMKEAAGVDLHIVARSYFAGVPQEMTLRCIELLGETKKLL